MFSKIRKRQRPISRGLIILLLGSWISYVCQPCFADTDVHSHHHETVDKMPCHPVNNTQDRHDTGDSKKSSMPDCDCHFFIALTVQYPDAWSAAGAATGFDLPLYISQGIDMETWSFSTGAGYRYPRPERALSPPFGRYTVLLN
jgi:hypothetical protein